MNFRILGTLQAEVDGNMVDLGPPKQRSLLALLLLNANQSVATDRLIDLIWGDGPPRTAAHSIQIYVSPSASSSPTTTGESKPDRRATA